MLKQLPFTHIKTLTNTGYNSQGFLDEDYVYIIN